MELQVRRLVVDSKYAHPWGSSHTWASDFAVSLPQTVHLPRGCQARINMVSIPHSQTINVSANQNQLWKEEQRTHLDHFNNVVTEEPIINKVTLDPGPHTVASLAVELAAKLNASTQLTAQKGYNWKGGVVPGQV